MTPSRTKVFICQPDGVAAERPCAKKILGTLARRAFRRPVTTEDVESLMRSYDKGVETQDGGFVAGVQPRDRTRPSSIPSFSCASKTTRRMHRQERFIDSATSKSRLGCRFFSGAAFPTMSCSIWRRSASSPSPRCSNGKFVECWRTSARRPWSDSFVSQWLGQRKLRGIAPIPELFPEFDENLRQAFLRETELFVESQLREDRSVLDLLRANYTYVNEKLARHYGISGVYGNHFRRVTLSDPRRGGLLGHGGILALTSYPNRTSPVLRGHWVLKEMLGAPPPPPPPDVPALPDTGDNGKLVSVRERLEQHRRNPVCAACHSRMDPLGFALENYDPIGRWRETSEDGAPIDASGTAADGNRSSGIVWPAGILAQSPRINSSTGLAKGF